MSWKEGDTLELDDSDEIANVVGSSYMDSASGSWKEFWLQYSGRRGWPSTCQFRGCGGAAELGAHVRVKRYQQYFIIPACYSCNNRDDKNYGSGWSSAKKDALVVWAGAVND